MLDSIASTIVVTGTVTGRFKATEESVSNHPQTELLCPSAHHEQLEPLVLTAQDKAEQRELERVRRAKVKARDLNRKLARTTKRNQAY